MTIHSGYAQLNAHLTILEYSQVKFHIHHQHSIMFNLQEAHHHVFCFKLSVQSSINDQCCYIMLPSSSPLPSLPNIQSSSRDRDYVMTYSRT